MLHSIDRVPSGVLSAAAECQIRSAIYHLPTNHDVSVGPGGDIIRGDLRLTALAAGALAPGTSRQDEPSCRGVGGQQLGILFLEFFVSGLQCANQSLRFAGEAKCKISSRIS